MKPFPLILAAGLLAGGASGPLAGQGAADAPPNILLILADNLGKDWLGCYGSDEGATPNLDRLAAEGLRFDNFYVTALCSTTRAALVTGRYGWRTGWHTHHDAAIYGGGFLDPESEVVFARPLRAAGHATAVTGKWQINDLYEQTGAMQSHGFDAHTLWTGALAGEGTAEERWMAQRGGERRFEGRYWDPVVFRDGERLELPGRFGPEVYVEDLVGFMRREREGPFFAFYSTPLVHVPVVRTPLDPGGEPAEEREAFARMVEYLDHQVGGLVEALEELGLRERTAVFFLSDNGTGGRLGGRVGGAAVRGGLGRLTEPGINVPLIVNWPGRVEGGGATGRLVDCTDLYPTLLEIAGASPPEGVALDGRSFADEILGAGAGAPPRSWMLAQNGPERVLSDGRFKLYNDGRFFDLRTDPQEERDLAGAPADGLDPEAAAARERLRAVHDELPPDTEPPFEPRSQSAFRMRGEEVR